MARPRMVYYFENYGAAGMAARRQAGGKNAAVFVISTPVELAEGDLSELKIMQTLLMYLTSLAGATMTFIMYEEKPIYA